MLIKPGQVAVVTGAAQGLGAALTTALVDRGVSVVLADRKQELLTAAANSLSAKGGRVLAVVTDVRDAASVEALACRTLDHFGRIDILVNNAGIVSSVKPIWETDSNEWQRVLAVNLLGVVHGLQIFMPYLIQAGAGHVLNIASRAGITTEPFASVYCASKHAVVAVSETLHGELEFMGLPIGVTVACPGFIRTPMTQPMLMQAAAACREQAGATTHGPGGGAVEQLRATALLAAAEVIEPDVAAGLILDAVEANRLYAFTHRDADGEVRRRAEGILGGLL